MGPLQSTGIHPQHALDISTAQQQAGTDNISPEGTTLTPGTQRHQESTAVPDEEYRYAAVRRSGVRGTWYGEPQKGEQQNERNHLPRRLGKTAPLERLFVKNSHTNTV